MKKPSFRAAFWMLFFSTLSLSGCGGGATADKPNATPAVTLASISVTPTSPGIVKGETLQFTATGTYSDNSTGDISSSVTWTSTANATVSNTGLATGTETGTSTISASLDGKTDSAVLTVTASAVAPTITTQPSNKTVSVGQTATFSVTASGTSPFIYQWKKGTTNVGTNSSSYTTPYTAQTDNGSKFSVVVTNSAGYISSNEATLTVTAQAPASYVADYRVATDAALRAIPDNNINTARNNLHVAYFHTSHGTHVSYGVFGLPGFKSGDATKFGVTNNTDSVTDKLDFHDNYGPDLSQADADWPGWRNQVRTYLDDPANAAINVMMWSWCDIAGHNVSSYLTSMQTLINEYGAGGSKIGTGTGKTRTTPVTFIFMTGHANVNANTGTGNPKEQAALITNYCNAHGYFCLDYYSIDTHAMDGTYYEDAGDDGDSANYYASVGNTGSGSFYIDWQASHTKGGDWYENRETPEGSITFGIHNNQHITANRKAFAFWWILARIAGYNPGN